MRVTQTFNRFEPFRSLVCFLGLLILAAPVAAELPEDVLSLQQMMFRSDATFKVPDKVDFLIIQAVGGGGGGGGGGGMVRGNVGSSGGSGGQGVTPTTIFQSVEPGTMLAITVGKGGNGGAGGHYGGRGADGSAGTESTVTGQEVQLRFLGGSGGSGGMAGGRTGVLGSSTSLSRLVPVYVTGGGSGGANQTAGQPGESTTFSQGGTRGPEGGIVGKERGGGGGGGGGGGAGKGGRGGAGGPGNGAGQDGGLGGSGAGGGGGGGTGGHNCGKCPDGGVGGDGGSGFVRVIWFDNSSIKHQEERFKSELNELFTEFADHVRKGLAEEIKTTIESIGHEGKVNVTIEVTSPK